jgi:RNA polymerase sigma-70 factor (ECF subfamily)
VPVEIEHLYREHRAGLVRLVERELRDHHDAEDVVQTAFLDAQRALERGTIPRNPHAWLATIALNAARRLRRRHVNAEPLEDYAVQEALGVSEIRAAFASLPREQRVAVLYRDVLGLSYDETAARMGTSVNAVTMLLHRGRKRLRQTLGVTTAGVALGRWLKRLGVPQVAAAKGATAIVVAAGLATAGIVAARVVAPIGADAAPAAPTRTGTPTARAVRPSAGTPAHGSARSHRDPKKSVGSKTGTSAAPSSTTPATAAAASPATLAVPTVSLPKLSVPTVTVPTTVAVSTPIATVTVTTPPGTTATVTTPITTITLPIP